MPAPDNEWWSTDYYLYKYLYKPLSEHTCVVPPNVITLLSFIMTFPILFALFQQRSLPILLLFVFIRQSFDCLDGAVARSCDTGSKLGAYLDIWSDIVAAAIFLVAVILYLISKKRIEAAWGVGIGGGIVWFNLVAAAVKSCSTHAKKTHTSVGSISS
jgi:phosphatidylglycerophosphate synthase